MIPFRFNALLSSIFLVSMFLPYGSFESAEGNCIINQLEVPSRNGQIDGPVVEICTWKDDKECALSLTFDDGLNSQLVNATPLMDILDIDGTFFITTNNVGIPYGGTWEEWQNAVINGHEIGSHTITHPDLTSCNETSLWEEIVLSRRIIEENLTRMKCETFSYPMGLFNDSIRELVTNNYIGARMDRHNITGPPAPVPTSPGDLYSVVPVNFGSGTGLSEMSGLVDMIIKDGGWLVEMIHGVGSTGYDPVPVSVFSDHLEYITAEKDVVWTDTFGNVVKYIRSRDNAIPIVEGTGDGRWNISMISNLDPETQNVPLTLNITLPRDFIDVKVMEDDRSSMVSLNITEDGYYFLIDIGLDQTISIEKNNIHPEIGPYVRLDGNTEHFSPIQGSSSDQFTFFLNYSSTAGRSPMTSPRLIIDLMGDGSTIIAHNMSKMDEGDIDPVNGILFLWTGSFPPGTDIKYRYEVEDSAGLTAVGQWDYSSWMKGPFLNDPPSLGSPIVYGERQGNVHHFHWEQGNDPDGDCLTYNVSYLEGNDTFYWTMENTSLVLTYDFEPGVEYWMYLTCMDAHGASSNTSNVSFVPGNRPPPAVFDLNVTVNHWGNADIRFSRVVDPDGDVVFYDICYFETDNIPEDVFSKGMEDQLFDDEHILNLSLIDERDYSFLVSPVDRWGAYGPIAVFNLSLDTAPAPIEGLTVRDLEGEEDGLVIEWTPSDAVDLNSYLIYRWTGLSDITDIEKAQMHVVSNESSSFIDRNVTDGTDYRYCAIASDGKYIDTTDILVVRGTPVDDVDPYPVSGLNVSIRQNRTGGMPAIQVRWEPSGDGRFLEYRIYRSRNPLEDLSNETPYISIVGKRNSTSFIDEVVGPDVRYHYTVTVVDEWGNEKKNGLLWKSAVVVLDGIDEEPSSREVRSRIPYLAAVIIVILVVTGILLFFLFSRRQSIEEE